MHRFIARHADKITGVLTGFDRLVLRGRRPVGVKVVVAGTMMFMPPRRQRCRVQG